MNKKMKYHPHGGVLFCTFSVEEGLLLLANPLCEAIIRFFRALMQKARAVRERWKLGDVTVPYPPGLYPPSMPKLANVLPR